MSHAAQTPAQTAAVARAEARTETFLFAFVAVVLGIGIIGFAIWGLQALAMIGLAATVLVYAMLAAYAAGL